MSEQDATLTEMRERGLKSLTERVERLKKEGSSKEVITFDIEQVLSKTALSSLMFGVNIRAVIEEMALVLAEADKLLGEIES